LRRSPIPLNSALRLRVHRLFRGVRAAFQGRDREDCSLLAVSTANSFVAGAVLGIAQLGVAAPEQHAALMSAGLFGGMAFMASFLALTRAFDVSTVGATMTALRLSLVIPILVGIALWGERATPAQAIGVMLVCVSLAPMTWTGSPSPAAAPAPILPVVVVFVCEGLAKTALRMVPEFGLDSH